MLEELGPRLGVLDAGLLEVRHVVGGRERDPEPGHRPPAGFRLAALGGERIPAAILLAELVDDVTHFGQLVLEQERHGAVRADHVVARLRLGFRRELGIELQMGDGVDAHGDARLLAERLGLLAQLVVGGGHEVIPRQERQLALLRDSGRRHAGEHGGAGHGARGGLEKAATAERNGHGTLLADRGSSQFRKCRLSTGRRAACQVAPLVRQDAWRPGT